MPMVSTTSKKHITMCQKAFERLELGLGSEVKNIKSEIIYAAYDNKGRYTTDEGPAMLAVASLGNNKHALSIPEYLTEEQSLFILELFLRDADSEDHLIVFSETELDLVRKILYGKNVDVKILT